MFFFFLWWMGLFVASDLSAKPPQIFLMVWQVGGDCPDTNYLFMGDFVDRGFYSVGAPWGPWRQLGGTSSASHLFTTLAAT